MSSFVEIEVRGDHITLGQLLKVGGLIDSGGEARAYLDESPVRVNGTSENRRGRKLVPGDRIQLKSVEIRLRSAGRTRPEREPGND